jgi:hypothetical protein
MRLVQGCYATITLDNQTELVYSAHVPNGNGTRKDQKMTVEKTQTPTVIEECKSHYAAAVASTAYLLAMLSLTPGVTEERIAKCSYFVGVRFRNAPNAREVFPMLNAAVALADTADALLATKSN